MSDADLIAAVSAGDQEALAAIFDREAPLALALALRLVDDRSRAEEIVHDVFLAFWNQAEGVDSGANVRLWIWDHVRRTGAGRRLLLIEPDVEVAGTFRDFLVDLGFEVTVHTAVRPSWPDVMAWSVVVLNTAGERSADVMDSLRTLRSAPETAGALIVCGGWTDDESVATEWLASNRVTALPGPVDMARLGDLLRSS